MEDNTNSLTIIGAGKLGKTLGRLVNQQTDLQITEVLNRSLESAQQAVAFIGAGRAITSFSELQPAGCYLLACPDTQIEVCCQHLAASGVLQSGTTVFHCSGSLNSKLLHSATDEGARVASVHPVRSFAEPLLAVTAFAGTYCGMEGDATALEWLEALFARIGGIPFGIDPRQKAVYHAASVLACNYLVVLQEMSIQAFAQAGVERELAMKILQPLVEGTVNNIFALGPEKALTGPVARGDAATVSHHLDALQEWQPDIAALYRELGKQALSLAALRYENGTEVQQEMLDTLYGQV